jgi:signal transduction histidine kinase/CheY-like chemotaxis protein
MQTNEKKLKLANLEIVFQNKEKDKRAYELTLANEEKEKREGELVLANKELVFQNAEKDKRAAELILANEEKERREGELVLANKELVFQNAEKDKRAAELILANEEKDKLIVSNEAKDKLILANAEKELLLRELQQSQKMEALGKLTGGIAHEYNNMLGIMLGYSELLKDAFIDNPKLFKYADQIQNAGNRAAKLTSKMLAFSQEKVPSAEIMDLNALVQKQQHMLEKTLTISISLVYKLQRNLWQVWLDGNDMEDAILNVCINAMHAMNEHGQLTIETHNKKIDPSDAASLNIKAGDYVLLSFTDDGCGFNKETKEKMFDPFFTTKGQLGTGLGLSIVYGFVQNSGGVIDVYSVEGEGTKFAFYFPRYLGTHCDKTPEIENSFENNSLGNESILVVDDEAELLGLTREILTLHGYNVFCAGDATEALSLLEREHIDIMISDVIMSGIDGYQLATVVKEKYPDVEIQLISGYTDRRNTDMGDGSLRRNLLSKPVSSKVLLKRIRKLSDDKK